MGPEQTQPQPEPPLATPGEWARLLVETVRDYAIFITDPGGTILTWNVGVEHVLGYAADEFVGQPLSICYTQEDLARGKPGIELQAAAANGRYQEQGWRLRKGGTPFWADEVLIALTGSAGLSGFGKVVRDLTGRREADKWLHSAVEHALDGVVIIDERGTVQTFNRQAERIFGYTPAEVIGHNVNMLMPEPYAGEHDGYLANYLRTGSAKIIGIGREVAGRRKDGSTFPLELAVGEFGLDGRRHFIGSVRDISPVRERLRQQEAAARLGQAALMAEDPGALMNEVLDTTCQTLGVEFGKVLELLPDGHTLLLRAGVGWRNGLVGHATLDSREGSQAGYTLLCDEPVVVEDLRTERRFAPVPLLREHGVVSGMSVVIRGRDAPYGVLGVHTARKREFGRNDVNFLQSVANVLAASIQRRQAEETVRRAHDDLRHVIDSNIVGIAFWNLQGLITDANSYCLALLGYSADDLAAGTVRWTERTPPEYRERDNQAIAEARASGRFAPFEKEFIRKDGTRVPVLISGALRSGADTGVAFILDLSDRKRLEEQFRQAQKMEAIGKLAGGVAHDFNNLLTVINAYSDMLLASENPETPEHEMLTEISKAGRHATQLTQQLLAFSRQQVLEPKVLDLNAVITDTARILRRLIGEHVLMALNLDPALRPVRVDPGQVQQILINLAVNARDAMPSGGRLTIETRNARADERAPQRGEAPQLPIRGYSVVTVTDTGAGMDDSIKAHVFEPFFTTKEPGKGTGLGLATVYGIVTQSGGFIEFDTAVGRGTTFHVYFPHAPRDVSAPVPAADLSLPTGNETILLAEDDASVRSLALRILRKAGYHVLEAANGKAALALAQEYSGPIHLLVSDVVMPHMGGRELAGELARIKPGIKVLVLSGYTDDVLLRDDIRDNELAFLQKPFTARELALKVRQVLGGTGTARREPG